MSVKCSCALGDRSTGSVHAASAVHSTGVACRDGERSSKVVLARHGRAALATRDARLALAASAYLASARPYVRRCSSATCLRFQEAAHLQTRHRCRLEFRWCTRRARTRRAAQQLHQLRQPAKTVRRHSVRRASCADVGCVDARSFRFWEPTLRDVIRCRRDLRESLGGGSIAIYHQRHRRRPTKLCSQPRRQRRRTSGSACALDLRWWATKTTQMWADEVRPFRVLRVKTKHVSICFYSVWCT